MDYEAILTEAHAEAAAAVYLAAFHMDEMKGACGFAWVTISGTEPLARYCRKQLKAFKTDQVRAQQSRQYGDKGYPSGWQFWNPGNYGGQRIDIKEAGAKAFMMTLAKYGIRGTVGSRLD